MLPSFGMPDDRVADQTPQHLGGNLARVRSVGMLTDVLRSEHDASVVNHAIDCDERRERWTQDDLNRVRIASGATDRLCECHAFLGRGIHFPVSRN